MFFVPFMRPVAILITVHETCPRLFIDYGDWSETKAFLNIVLFRMFYAILYSYGNPSQLHY